MNRYLSEKNSSACCGCGMCAEICPKKCIEMKADEEGFFYPSVDASLCVDCDKCSSVCPSEKRPEMADRDHPEAYAAYSHKNDFIMNSSSGGMFPEIAEGFIQAGGVVCGVTIDQSHQVFHTVIDSAAEISRLQGSKYVQSDLRRCLPKIKKILLSGRKLLFTGTPCQVAAVIKACNCDNLYTLDVLCHGVPSQKLFDTYIAYLEKKHHGRLTEIAFRDKEKNGWSITQRYKIQRKGTTRTYYLDRHLSEYFSGFLRNMTQRESCYHCLYSTTERVGDITLADFWGVDKVRPELYHKDGTSLMFVNSKKGDELKHLVLKTIQIDQVDIKDATYQNVNFISPPERNPARKDIYKMVFARGFSAAGRKILPSNAYKYRIWAFLQNMHMVSPIRQKR